jgi:hypothetical protein
VVYNKQDQLELEVLTTEYTAAPVTWRYRVDEFKIENGESLHHFKILNIKHFRKSGERKDNLIQVLVGYFLLIQEY